MPRPRVYVETTIPSYYHESRAEPSIVARREWTRQWWVDAPARYDLVTSEAVLEELERGPAERVGTWLSLLRGIPLLPLPTPIDRIVEEYISQKVMPAWPEGDAVHLAAASYHRCDLLVTWDRRHLANPNKFRHIRKVNLMLGLFVPSIVTPRELLEGNHGSR